MPSPMASGELETLMGRFDIPDREGVDVLLDCGLSGALHIAAVNDMLSDEDDAEAITRMLMFRLVELRHFTYLGDDNFVPAKLVN